MKKLLLLCIATLLFSVNAYAQYGDANNDGVVNASDSAAALNYTLNPQIKIDKTMADTNGDGIVNAADSAAILQKTLNSSYKFVKEQEDPVIDTDELTAEALPYGVYTKDFTVGDITVSASAIDPVYVQDICYEEDLFSHEKHYVKALVLGDENSFTVINCKTASNLEIAMIRIPYDRNYSYSFFGSNPNTECDTIMSLPQAGYGCDINNFKIDPNIKYEFYYSSYPENDKPLLVKSVKFID